MKLVAVTGVWQTEYAEWRMGRKAGGGELGTHMDEGVVEGFEEMF